MLEQLKIRLRELEKLKEPFNSIFTDIATYILPQRGDFVAEVTKKKPKQRKDIHDTTGRWALNLLVAAVDSFLINASERWLVVNLEDNELMKKKEVKTFAQDFADVLYNSVFNNARTRFRLSATEFLTDVVGFGTGVLFVEDVIDQGVRCKSISLSNVFMDTDRFGVVDTLYKKFSRSARNLAQQYPDRFTEEFMSEHNIKPDDELECIHAVEPDGKQWLSVVFLTKFELILSEGFFTSFPYIVARWRTEPESVYGSGVGVDAMPEIKQINQMKDTVLRARQLSTHPPLQVPENAFMLPVNTQPGAINYFIDGTQSPIQPIVTGARPDIGDVGIEDARLQIMRIFFIDQLRLAERTPQMTATEVLKRNEDQMRLLGPQIARLQAEFLDPIIGRVIEILSKRGELPEMPVVLEGEKLKLVYISQVTRAQKATQLFSVNRLFESITPIAQLKPEILDKIDGDALLEWEHSLLDAPERILRTQEVVDKIRNDRAQVQQEALNSQMATQDASALKDQAQARNLTNG